MATADDYLYAIERCRCHAELASSQEAKQMWFDLAESYHLVLMADEVEDCGALIQPVETAGLGQQRLCALLSWSWPPRSDAVARTHVAAFRQKLSG